jgi:malonyl-CoA O-methyltransferase
MRVKQEFSRFATEYEQYNIIQQRVAKKLIDDMHDKPKRVLDLGCGSGTVYKLIEWELQHYTAIDFSESMLQRHPKADHITCKLCDFNSEEFLDEEQEYDRIISASALQWSEDLDSVFKKIAALKRPVSLAIFTCKTFHTIYELADLEPILRSSEEIMALSKKHFDAEYELVEYTLAFQSTTEMFRYIKKSGVSGGRRVLNFKQTKKLMREYPHDYLEFEVLFIQN